MRPRLNKTESNKKYIYAQIIDDTKGITLVSASFNDSQQRSVIGGDKAAAKANRLPNVHLKRHCLNDTIEVLCISW